MQEDGSVIDDDPLEKRIEAHEAHVNQTKEKDVGINAPDASPRNALDQTKRRESARNRDRDKAKPVGQIIPKKIHAEPIENKTIHRGEADARPSRANGHNAYARDHPGQKREREKKDYGEAVISAVLLVHDLSLPGSVLDRNKEALGQNLNGIVLRNSRDALSRLGVQGMKPGDEETARGPNRGADDHVGHEVIAAGDAAGGRAQRERIGRRYHGNLQARIGIILAEDVAGKSRAREGKCRVA